VNQGSSVNNILSEGPDLLGAEVVECPTILPSPSTSTPAVHRRRRRIQYEFIYKPQGVHSFLSLRSSFGSK
jgi:hypothetical protein